MTIDPRFYSHLAGAHVLVTGAGGSIGSRLCVLAAQAGAARITMLDRCEAALFKVTQALTEHRGVERQAKLHDVAHRSSTSTLIANLKPGFVFHAAAHKHVPMLEEDPAEAATNNVLATRNVLEGVQAVDGCRLVLVSTDKAVKPTSVMGMTKRLAECVCRGRHIVRFGNVIGSAGSVYDIWDTQRPSGQITVTDPDMTRYFMTIDDAAAMTAAVAGMEPGLYVFEMGEPQRIGTLADAYCREHGCGLRIIGPRPGERKHEPLPQGDGGVQETGVPGVLRVTA